MNASQSGAGTALAAFCALFNSGSLVFLSGAMPASTTSAASPASQWLVTDPKDNFTAKA